MKILAYAARPDEMKGFHQFEKELGLEITYVTQNLSYENAHLAQGFKGVTILGNCCATKAVLQLLAQQGVQFLASRSAGYNNIDLIAAKELGIRVSNATYSPNSVAEFAVMLMLMLNRRVSTALRRYGCDDYSLQGLIGKELRNQTIGVIGTGRIGQTVIKNLSGFGCEILAYDVKPSKELSSYATYVSLEELLHQSDIITLHAPLIDSNYHLINERTIAQMKPGVQLINTARGELINTIDLITNLESGHIGGVALDVLEGESGIFHSDCRVKGITHHELAILKQKNNVMLTNHYAFYTEQAVFDMVECGLKSLVQFMSIHESDWEIKC